MTSIGDDTSLAFDYSRLEPAEREVLHADNVRIRGLLADSATTAVELGVNLTRVRKRLGASQFKEWYVGEFKFSQPFVSKRMRAASLFQGLDCLGQFQPDALFVLAGRKVPPQATAEAIGMARAGAFISKLEAELIVWKHRGGLPPQAINAVNRFSSALKSLLASRRLLRPAQRRQIIRALALAQRELASDAGPTEARQSATGLKMRDSQLLV